MICLLDSGESEIVGSQSDNIYLIESLIVVPQVLQIGGTSLPTVNFRVYQNLCSNIVRFVVDSDQIRAGHKSLWVVRF